MFLIERSPGYGPMNPELPSLDAIKYFEVSARHQSFTRAGKELFLSQSAVSQKIIQLEDVLGYKLFFRRPRGLVLTPEGEILYQSAREAINLIKKTLRSIENQSLEGNLTIVTPPSAASKWLMPLLPGFLKSYPEINLRLMADITIADFETGQHSFKDAGIDIAICHRIIPSNDFHQELLCDDYIFPVCSPRLEQIDSIQSPEDMMHFPILREAYPKMDFGADWDIWLASVGMDKINSKTEHVFNQLDLMIQAAIAGQGIAMGRDSLVKEDIAAGRLVKLFDRVQTSSYYLTTLKELRQNPRISAFVDWIKGTTGP